jgi:gliding motility-associated-like protein
MSLKGSIYKISCLFALICTLFTVRIQAQLNANFSGTPLNGCAPHLVNFTNLSTGAVAYQWDLGNATQSTLTNPSATYFNPGTYTITLIAIGPGGQRDTMTKTAYIGVYAKPTVNFSASDTAGCYPLNVQFTDLSTAGSGNIVSWQWDFGDGTGSTSQNPSHVYQQGTFSVVLRVTNDKGCSTTIIKNNYIRAQFGTKAGFTFVNPNSCSVPVTINFTNTSTGTGILSYNWSFGDGGTSVLQNPSHTYSSNGSYTVTLLVTNNQGCSNTYTLTNAVSIGNNVAAFTTADSICQGANLAILNTSTPTPGTSFWTFGDGSFSVQTNPSKIYNTPGIYAIKLVADFGACKDSTTKNITVLAKPTVSFAANATSSCAAPFTVDFNSITSNATSYSWSFGDGGTSILPNPSHTYNTAGEYDVSVTVTNALGCSETITKVKYIKIKPLTLSFLNLPDSGCRPLTIVPIALINAVDGVASYNWNFGDGFTSTLANPSHTYNAVGTYTIKLIVTTNGGCVDSISAIVKVGTKPNVQFSATPTISCAYSPIVFTDLTVGGPPTFWYWQFGDGSVSYDQNPTYNYNDTGYFDVTLIVGSNGCYDTLKKFDYIYIKPPIAKFSPKSDCNNPFTWNFTDQSIAPLTWNWNFGDGVGTSTMQSPTYTYATPGVYTVGLTVSNGSCTHSITKVIRVIDERPDFSANQLTVCRNGTVDFTSFGYTRNNISSTTWNFGDGSVVIGDSLISHTYTQAGQFTVTLTMVDINGCIHTIVKNQYITVFGPKAGFASAAPGSCLNSAVIFTDLTITDGIHPIQTWYWNYGDGNTATLNNPPFQHLYTAQGVYTVSLKVIDSYGCIDSIQKPDYLIISKPVAAFSSPDTISCPNTNLVFNNASTGNNLAYTWYFGDGNTSNAFNPVHQYLTDGVYTVKLVVTDQYGCIDSMVKTQYILISSPLANFTASDTFSTCPPLFVQFTNTSISYINSAWDFGDGSTSSNTNPSHFYTSPGTFVAKLTVTTTGGCTHIYTKNIVIKGPSGVFTYNPLQGCSPLSISFTANTQNTTNYVWDYNNGQTVSTTNAAITYTYTQPGKYLPRLILKDDLGCSIPILGNDSITVFGVTNTINSSSLIVCDSGMVNFTANALSNDAINNYLWKFGDGATSILQNPTHRYVSNGSYTVQCIVTTQLGCKDTTVMQLPIRVIESPIIAVTGTPGACIPATAQFAPQIIRNDTSALTWFWNFGNGQTSTLMNPPAATYPNAGIYTVTSIVTSSSGCKDTASYLFNAWALPVVDAGLDKQICRNTPTQLVATGANNYIWSPAIGLSCVNCPNPSANPDTTRKYYLTGVDGNGCVNKDSVQVKVIQRFVMTNSPGASFCLGKYVTLNANGANSYAWSPAAGLSATTGNTVIAKPTVTTNYRLIGSDAFNCFKDTAFINIIVYPLPTVNAGNDQTIVGGSTAQLSATTTGGVVNYIWSPVATLSCSNCPNPVATPTKTTTYNVEVTNAGGCKSNDDVTVFVVCDKGNLFVPNTFSPNGDGMNDVLYPRGNGVYAIKTLKVFNRWGEMVFEKNNFSANDASKGWDGTYKGKMSSPDVFVYLIEVVCENGTPLSFKGNVSLIQ